MTGRRAFGTRNFPERHGNALRLCAPNGQASAAHEQLERVAEGSDADDFHHYRVWIQTDAIADGTGVTFFYDQID